MKDKAHAIVAQPRPAIFVQFAQPHAIQPHIARTGLVQPGAQAEQGGLAAARRAEDRASGALRQRKADVANHRKGAVATAISFAQPLHFQDGARIHLHLIP